MWSCRPNTAKNNLTETTYLQLSRNFTLFNLDEILIKSGYITQCSLEFVKYHEEPQTRDLIKVTLALIIRKVSTISLKNSKSYNSELSLNIDQIPNSINNENKIFVTTTSTGVITTSSIRYNSL